jgi:hypothetical protein
MKWKPEKVVVEHVSSGYVSTFDIGEWFDSGRPSAT